MSLSRAIRRATGTRRAPGRVTPVEQVLRARQRPLVRHTHHQHLTATTVRLHVTAPLHVISVTHPVRARAAGGGAPGAAGPPTNGFPDPVFRSPDVLAAGDPAPTGAAIHTPARSVQGLVARAATAAHPLPGHPPAAPPTRVELVHRQPPQTPAGSATDWPPQGRAESAYARPGTEQQSAAGTYQQAWGTAPLTDADVPRVVDHVVRELDRRLVATRERRGWTS